MVREIAFRIDSDSKLYLKNKVNELGINLSKLVRMIIDNSPIFADVLNTNNKSINFFKKHKFTFNVINNIHRFIIKK